MAERKLLGDGEGDNVSPCTHPPPPQDQRGNRGLLNCFPVQSVYSFALPIGDMQVWGGAELLRQ